VLNGSIATANDVFLDDLFLIGIYRDRHTFNLRPHVKRVKQDQGQHRQELASVTMIRCNAVRCSLASLVWPSLPRGKAPSR
jgi:hypothetical protein